MSRPFIPNSAPWITDREISAVLDALHNNRIASNAENLRAAKEGLKQFTGGNDVLLTTSCSVAMELALRCLNLQPGDEVILPSFTFTSTANAILQCGAKPVFVEIEDRTLNLDLADIERACTTKTKAIMPVHYAGISCDMDRLMEIARDKKIAIVEDAAHALGAKYKNRFLGTLGDFGCFSFHDTKNCVCGEGGALVIGNPKYRHLAECIYEKGTNRSAFLRGEIDKYTWVTQGSSYPMAGMLATFLAVQLARFEEIHEARRSVAQRYRNGLSRLVDEGHIRFGEIPAYATPNDHIAYFIVNDVARRNALLAHLKSKGIGAVFHYIPLHVSPFAKETLGTRDGQFPVTERIAESIVRLPLYPQMSDDDCAYVIENVIGFFNPSEAKPTTSSSYGTSATRGNDYLDLTLVVPCYNESGHLHQSLSEVLGILDRTSLKYEVILIDDCSKDDTASLIREFLTLHPHHKLRAVFHEKNQGRGATATEGIRMARGRFTGFLDIDLEVHARYIPGALQHLLNGKADMVLADRSYKFHLFSLTRFLATTQYKALVRRMLKTPPLDTEAGFKFFRRDAILPVLDKTEDPYWFWDTEVTVRAHDAGLRIHSEPVLFNRRREKKSTVKLFRDSWRSFARLLAFARSRRQ